MSAETFKALGTADLHTHNIFSRSDASATPDQIARRFKRLGYAHPYLGVTNHNTIEGSAEVLEACKRVGLEPLVITGEEIALKEKNPVDKYGELIGLFLHETIPAHSTIDEVITSIRAQSGMLVIPHMFEFWRHGIGSEMAQEVIRKCYGAGIPVAVEIFNARATPKNNKKAIEFARKWNSENSAQVLPIAGSDAHCSLEYGKRVAIMMPHFTDRDSFIEALSGGIFLTTDDSRVNSALYRAANKFMVKAGKLKGQQRVEF